MIRSTSSHRAFALAISLLLPAAGLLAGAASLRANDKFGFAKKKPGPASTSLDDYLKRVGAVGAEQPSTVGSLWVSSGPLSSITSDYKAHAAGDLIIVQLVDTFSAAT